MKQEALVELSSGKLKDYEKKARSDWRTWSDLDKTHRKLHNQKTALQTVAKRLGKERPAAHDAFSFAKETVEEEMKKEVSVRPINGTVKDKIKTIYPGDPKQVNGTAFSMGASKKLAEHLQSLVAEDYYQPGPNTPKIIQGTNNHIPDVVRDDEVFDDDNGAIDSRTPPVSGLRQDHMDKMKTVISGKQVDNYPDPYVTKAMNINQHNAAQDNAVNKIGTDKDDIWSQGAAIESLETYVDADGDLSKEINDTFKNVKEEVIGWTEVNEATIVAPDRTTAGAANSMDVMGLISMIAAVKVKPAFTQQAAETKATKLRYLANLINAKKKIVGNASTPSPQPQQGRSI